MNDPVALETSMHSYTSHDHSRYHHEPASTERRTDFGEDRLRVLGSAALRRLANVTQVDEPDAGPAPHNRLSHSLSVAAVGARLATEIGADPIVVETACLAHDLGHPPYGHNGEHLLRNKAHRHGLTFEANAQTLRILTRLAAGGPDGTAGLNLTRACLDATCKYPWTPGKQRKFGAYPDDSGTLAWIRESAPAQRLCLEAQIMDFADDIANAVDDVSNGLRSGAITLTALADPQLRATLVRLARGHFTTMPTDKLDRCLTDLTQLPALAAACQAPAPVSEVLIAALGQALTGWFVSAVADATRASAGPGPHARFSADLGVSAPARGAVAVLKALHLHFVLRDPALRARRVHQWRLLDTVFDTLVEQAPRGLPAEAAARWVTVATDAGRLRVIVDHVAALTDRGVVEAYSQLTDTRSRPSHKRQAAI